MGKVWSNIILCLLVAVIFMMPISTMNNQIVPLEDNEIIMRIHEDDIESKKKKIGLAHKDSQSELKWIIAGDSIRGFHSYWLHVPPSYDGSEGVPLVIVLQGSHLFNWGDPFGSFRESISRVENQKKFSEKADEEGFIVVYPNAKLFFHHIESGDTTKFDYNYDWTPPLELGYIYDIGFIRTLIHKMKQEYSINSKRIYVTGFSAGALMTYSVGAHLSDEIAAMLLLLEQLVVDWMKTTSSLIFQSQKILSQLLLFMEQMIEVSPMKRVNIMYQ